MSMIEDIVDILDDAAKNHKKLPDDYVSQTLSAAAQEIRDLRMENIRLEEGNNWVLGGYDE